MLQYPSRQETLLVLSSLPENASLSIDEMPHAWNNWWNEMVPYFGKEIKSHEIQMYKENKT